MPNCITISHSFAICSGREAGGKKHQTSHPHSPMSEGAVRRKSRSMVPKGLLPSPAPSCPIYCILPHPCPILLRPCSIPAPSCSITLHPAPSCPILSHPSPSLPHPTPFLPRPVPPAPHLVGSDLLVDVRLLPDAVLQVRHVGLEPVPAADDGGTVCCPPPLCPPPPARHTAVFSV